MSAQAPVHHAVTSDPASTTSTAVSTTTTTTEHHHKHHHHQHHLGHHETSVQNPEVAALSATADPAVEGRRASLVSTPNPLGPAHQEATTDQLNKDEVPPSSSVGTHNAPGKAGRIGENAMGALGFGGTHVERPPQDQGLGEKIVNFLGV